ncbi:PREDICTED: uncharacterized protein LOC108574113 [Habropoda laboriosa]|uniref:uncharacterized protein LOC108574113 n=1 Tax=Habropoda laboriosa TaxID=597456 RepID=UPI00083D8B1A|nr:PREDICTED: uncharacterized protein LOC108574113 [Habropoda laboriosa]
MFGRQIFLEPVDNERDQRRRDEFFRQFCVNQRRGIPFTELTNIPSLRNDGLMLDLNLILVDDTDRVQPNNLYFRTNYGNALNRYLLEYVRQMEERYLAMERELTRTKMLIPVMTRNFGAVHQTSQTDVNRKQSSFVKYEHIFGTSPRNQYRKNQEQVNHVSSRRKHHTTRKNKDLIAKTLLDTDWTKQKNPSQNSQNDIYPIKEPGSHSCRPRTLTSNSTAVCSMHNVAVILPQGSTQLTNFSRHGQLNSKVMHTELINEFYLIFHKRFPTTTTIVGDEKASMDICQSFDKKHEPETTCYTDFDVKQEDHMQTNSTVNTPEFRPITRPKLNNDISEQKSELEQPPSHRPHLNTDFEGKCNNNHWNNRSKKCVPRERSNCTDDLPRYFTRTIQKPKKDVHKRIPTPRSNVHTAYTPMVQSPTWNPMLDPNGLTIQLLRLAVLLYAPALMPALNSLIARQTVQTSIPIPSSEGANDLLTQIFTILSNQQSVPNLSYVSNPRVDENSQYRESRQQSHSENIARQHRNDNCDRTTSVNDQLEKNSIAVDTSLEICGCNKMKQSSSQYSEDILRDEKTEENEELLYTWTDKKSKSSEEKKGEDAEEKQDDAELFGNSSIRTESNVWKQLRVNDIWKFESNTKLNEFE